MLDALAMGIVSAALFYVVKRLDAMDVRIDNLDKHLTKIEERMPRRKTDYQSPVYLENSGIEA